MGQDSTVSIATHYRLSGLRIGSWWGVTLPTSIQNGPGAHPTSYKIGTRSFPWVMRPGSGVNHPSPCSTDVKETVELYVYSPSVPTWHIILILDRHIFCRRSKQKERLYCKFSGTTNDYTST